ncbi:MAG: flotillin family protein [Aureispira sp.]|nr:flotillin family protein [Aureispira sp.]
MFGNIIIIIVGVIVAIIIGFFILVAKAHKKVPQGRALIRTGMGGAKVALDSGMFVIPVLHKVEEMDISLKTIEVARMKEEGLICQDNLRADIKVVFFVRVNKDKKDIIEVAQTIGCERASKQETLNNLFDAKFSEALKTVGKQFEFVDLYTERNGFKNKILEIIGTDLNGYILDDCAIDYLEQTPLAALKQDNILDSEGIKKIEELTSIQIQKTNEIVREREKTIKQQDVEAREAILQLELQQTEKEERQKRAIFELKTHEGNAAEQVKIDRTLATELLQKQAEEKLGIQEEDKLREISMARLRREEMEKVREQQVSTKEELEIQIKERAVGEAIIDKEKALETKKRDIQSIIKERKAEEKKTVEEDQRIKDTEQIMTAEREHKVTKINAEKDAEALKIKEVRQAEADKLAAEIDAKKIEIQAEADKIKKQKEAEARKIVAEAKAAEEATVGLAEADVIKAKAEAKEVDGTVDAKLIEAKAEAERKKGLAEAEVTNEKGIVDAKLIEQKGLANAKVIQQEGLANAEGIKAKAEAMKLLNDAGKDHEEFKLRLDQERQIRIAEIQAQLGIAEAQAKVLANALQNANIDIVGGETKFFDSIINAINKGKSIDRLVDNSQNLQDVKQALLGPGEENLVDRVRGFMQQYGVNSEAVRNLSMSALLTKLYAKASGADRDILLNMIESVSSLGMGHENVDNIL